MPGRSGDRRSRGLYVWVLAVSFLMTPLFGASAAGSSDPPARPLSPEFAKLKDAKTKIDAKQYEVAIPLLLEVVDTNARNADAHNLLGFSYRKLGRYPAASKSYRQALDIDPDHRGALEYQGELFLKLKQLDNAQKNLDRLDSLCWLPCEEYTDLKEAVAAYKAQRGS